MLPLASQNRITPDDRYHPAHGPRWLEEADGFTMVIGSLACFNRHDKPFLVIPPIVDERLFYPRPVNFELRRALKIPDTQIVIVYSGNVHLANAREVGQLYDAVSILNESGCPTTLIRTGLDPEWLQAEAWPRTNVISLGWVPRADLPDIVAAADIFVQPGEKGYFNDYRMPSKLPEYFAVGRPVILPRTNLGKLVRHELEAYVLEDADARSIADAVRDIRERPGLRSRLAAGAAAFHRSHPDAVWRTEKLLDLYQVIRTSPEQGTES